MFLKTRPSTSILLFFSHLLAGLAFAAAASAQVSSFEVVVPNNDDPGELQIVKMKAAVLVDSESPIAFTIDPPTGDSVTSPSLQPGDANWGDFLGMDTVSISTPDGGLTSDDPRRRLYSIVIDPNSDFDANCQSTMGGDETWTISVDGGASRIQDVCLFSQDRNIPGDECGGLRPSPLDQAAALAGIDTPEQTCRFGVEAVLVLDRSGSMGGKADPDEPAGPDNVKIEELSDAVNSFLGALGSVRSTEVTDFGSAPNDEVGFVIFNSNAEFLPLLGAGLHAFDDFTPATVAGQFGVSPDPVSPSGATSIGDGLLLADGELDGGGNRRRAILVMSDGRQNTDKLVGADVGAGRVFTYPPGDADGPDLPHLGNYQIYSVTVGTDGAVSSAINQDIARATGGFYLNSVDASEMELTIFFENVLRNFLETNTWQTVLAGSDTLIGSTPFSAVVPVTSTSRAIVAQLSWQGPGPLCLRVRAPGSADAVETCSRQSPARFQQTYGASPAGHLGGEWEFEVVRGPIVGATGDLPSTGLAVPFGLFVMTDDLGLDAKITSRADSFVVGEPVLVEAALSIFEEPLTGLPTGGLSVQVDSPLLTLGEVLSDSSAGTDRPADGDAERSAAGAKLQNEIENSPSALDKDSSSATLRDDGTGGDRQAGDGVYSARLTFELAGHTDLVVTLQGENEDVGTFRRQKPLTVYSKPEPDPDTTEIVTTIVEGSLVSYRATPRTRFGHRMGPGWANYFWVTAPGMAPRRLADNLDGTYSANIPFAGSPPEVTLHFIPDSVILTDEVTPEKLPSPLDDSTAVGRPVSPGGSPWSLSLHAGPNQPLGDFDDFFDGVGGLAADLEYLFPNSWALEAVLGFDRFDGTFIDPEILSLSLNVKRYIPWTPTRLWFLGAGLGAYELDPGSDESGVKVFGGVQFQLTPDRAAEVMLKYHSISGGDLEFLQALGGLRFRF